MYICFPFYRIKTFEGILHIDAENQGVELSISKYQVRKLPRDRTNKAIKVLCLGE